MKEIILIELGWRYKALCSRFKNYKEKLYILTEDVNTIKKRKNLIKSFGYRFK